ncbi:MAG TPA: beta-propeller fold lactonase family protein, partial [Spirochaetales bacterium]|nr:beta-propeller fold lactonase family protein [Spirochaetales bacterium]
ALTYERLPAPFGGAAGPLAGSAKRHLVVDPVRNRLYASDMGRGSVFAYDLAADRQLAEIPIAPNVKTNTIALSPDGRWLYASTRGPNNPVDYERKGPAFGELLVIDTDSLAIVERHWGGNQPTGLAVSPDGRLVVLTDFLDHRLEVYERVEALAHSIGRRAELRSIP